MTDKKMLEVRDAAFSYDGSRMIFENVNLSVDRGEVLCIVGPNGCGKSTLIDCILGLQKPGHGCILAGGRDIRTMKAKELAEHVAYVPQGHKTTFGYTVLDVVTMGRTYAARMFSPPGEKEKDIARDALRQVGLSGFEDRQYTQLSGGELQLVIIARAVAQQSGLLVMDEPTAHLDFTHEMRVMEVITELVKERKLSVIMATHFLNQAYYLENAGVSVRVALASGKGFSRTGTPSEILIPEVLEETFQIVTEIVTDRTGQRKYILPLYRQKQQL